MILTDKLMGIFGYTRTSKVKEYLNFARSVGKRLDEHREVVEAIDKETALFERNPWHASHMAIQDDYLMRLYYVVYGCWPDDDQQPWQSTGEHVRPRPKILRACRLPNFPSGSLANPK